MNNNRKIFRITKSRLFICGGSTLTFIDNFYVGENFVDSLLVQSPSILLKNRITSTEVVVSLRNFCDFDKAIFNFIFGDTMFEIKQKRIRSYVNNKIQNRLIRIIINLFLFCLGIYRPRVSFGIFQQNILSLIEMLKQRQIKTLFIINLPKTRNIGLNLVRKRYINFLETVSLSLDSIQVLNISNLGFGYRINDRHHLNMEGALILRKELLDFID